MEAADPMQTPEQEQTVLVTGANGFLGVKVVETLLEYGFTNIRCFVRPSSNLARFHEMVEKRRAHGKITIVKGDLLSREDCERATVEAVIVYHLAAGFDKSFAGAFMNSALATRNLVEAFLRNGKPKRFVNVSSFAVYSNLSRPRGAMLDENSPLEDCPQARYDAYAFGKLKQEEIVRRHGNEKGLRYVILRPGTVYGAGKRDLTGRIGINSFGFFMHIGGSNRLPMTYVDNCAEAIVLAGIREGIDGETFNVVDDETLTSREFLRAYKKKVGAFFSLRIPFWMANLMSIMWEKYSRWSKGQLPPVFNRRRSAAEWKGNRFSNQKIKSRLGWQPRVGVEKGMAEFLAQFDVKEAAK